MGSFGRLLITNIIVIIVLVGGGGFGYYYYHQSNSYVKTDNASIDGQQISIAPPVGGKLTLWNGQEGKTFTAGSVVGQVQTTDAKGQTSTTAITMPDDGTIALNNGVTNTFVAPGSPLAYAYNYGQLYVTANIKETNINKITVGQLVDLYVDAFPNINLTGRVQKIGLTTNSTFSLLPSSNSSGNFTKVTQVVPVRISIDASKGVGLRPGMNVTVRIHT